MDPAERVLGDNLVKVILMIYLVKCVLRQKEMIIVVCVSQLDGVRNTPQFDGL